MRLVCCGTWAGAWSVVGGRLAFEDEDEPLDRVVVVGLADGDDWPVDLLVEVPVWPALVLVDLAAVAGRASRNPKSPVAAVATTKLQRVIRETRSRPRSR